VDNVEFGRVNFGIETGTTALRTADKSISLILQIGSAEQLWTRQVLIKEKSEKLN
jgi:hypothetical protein